MSQKHTLIAHYRHFLNTTLIEDMHGLKTDTIFFLKTANGEWAIELQHKTT